MRIALCSDIHLEFGPISLTNDENADVLILSGDICIASEVRPRDPFEIKGMTDRSNRYHNFFQECCARFKQVIYIMGNHEHYHGDFNKSYSTLREHLGYLHNLHILEKESVMIDGVGFIGGTLWTDMNREDPRTIEGIRHYMNDYRTVDDSSEMVSYRAYEVLDKPVGMTDEEWLAKDIDERQRPIFKERPVKFSPEKSIKEHNAMLQFIDSTIKATPSMSWVVVGHHAPSKLSTKPQYERDVIVNGAYSTDLSNFILDRPTIKLWTHGHTHDTYDYMIGSTRIVCNPRGYIDYEGRAYDFKLQYIDI